MLVCSVHIISKVQMFTLFSGRHIGALNMASPYWALKKSLTNICSLGKGTDLKLGEVSSLFISYKITIS